MLYWVVRGVARTFFRVLMVVLGGFRVEQHDNVPRRGGVIIAPNHLSHLDPPAIGVALRRPVWFMATDELFAIRGLGTLARILHAFPVHQDSPDRSALRRTEELLKSGEAVVVFPEGHESVTGELQPVQPGVMLLAARAGVPIVPVGIVGTDAMLPATTFRPRRSGRPVRIRFGTPIPVEELTGGLKGRAGLDRGAEALRGAIAEILAELGREPGLLGGRAEPRPTLENGGIAGYSGKE